MGRLNYLAAPYRRSTQTPRGRYPLPPVVELCDKILPPHVDADPSGRPSTTHARPLAIPVMLYLSASVEEP